MVITRRPNHAAGALMIELMAALTILAAAVLPLAFSLAGEKRLAHSYYQRAVAMELVDGEVEALAAGQWRAFPQGTNEYFVRAGAVTNLPPGHFILIVQPTKVRLEWRPEVTHHGGAVVREATIR